ncbi:MAG: LytTR family DNA-binding domain-containing protein [Lachnospiraceae bacterium]|nr:LytTR family DNA-binding domain-containing protein [Lachnospiraceae bacterium]
MIQIAIVEDDKRFSATLQKCLDRYAQENDIQFRISTYTDGYAIVENYRKAFDIILMDIEMGLMNGMEAAREIRKTDQEVVIIFITNMAQYAIQGYAVSALDYVLKPINYVAFSESLKKAVAKLKNNTEKIISITLKSGMIRLKSSEIYWIESYGHHLLFHSSKGDYDTTVYSLREIEEKLRPDGFLRASSGMLVNLQKVTGTRNGYILVDGKELALSRGRKNEFMTALVSYMME